MQFDKKISLTGEQYRGIRYTYKFAHIKIESIKPFRVFTDSFGWLIVIWFSLRSNPSMLRFYDFETITRSRIQSIWLTEQ